ncbi:hypothetical protein VPNG_03007 [Cytospora leucostoma]|uniref:Uncharacterized protein n=1 Tax=Cytospora leucostoma TaxID=1230097 RepID=A0A423XGC5_9PEZI|nr:hypothetical protein VPNG_03007 [Cytospora leucostoma]
MATPATGGITSDIPSSSSAPFISSTPAPNFQGHRIENVAAGAPSPSHPAPSSIVRRGFPSPGRDHKTNPKLDEERNRLIYGFQQSTPEAVRRSVRDNWEKCLLGTDFHQAFVLNASIHHATPAAIRRGVRDFGQAMTVAAKYEIIDHMTTADLDQLADRILAKASNSFLDKALQLRIKTIEAVPLINALARAERLGYESSDVVEEKGPAAPAAGAKPLQQHTMPGAPSPKHNANKVCGDFGEPIKAPSTPAHSSTPPPRVPKPIPAPSTPAVAKSTPKSLGSADLRKGTPGLPSPSAGADPYVHLSPEQLTALQNELSEAEATYSERMRQANMIPDEVERKQRLDGLGNSFSTKQSLIRKKYGVRLRVRRTKAEIQTERDRMVYKTAAELMTDLDNNRAAAPQVSATTTGTAASNLPVPRPSFGTGPSTMDVTMHSDNKRRASGSTASAPNHKRIAYSEMGGLTGAAATAETEDPTVPPRIKSTPTIAKGKGTATEPMALDDTDNSDSEDSGDDSDIPAQLPAGIRQSLQRSGSAALGGGSRPGSSSTK